MDNRAQNSLRPPRGRGRPRGRPRLNQRTVVTPTAGPISETEIHQPNTLPMDENMSTGLFINLKTSHTQTHTHTLYI